jgi:hypothetical protein
MSLSDYIKYQRALHGGLTPWEIAEGSGVPARDVHLLEVKHRRMGEDDALLHSLSGFFGIPLEEFTNRREAYRKRLSYFLDESRRESRPVILKLESGEELRGTVTWYSREALGLVPEGAEAGTDDIYVVQRGWVADWRRNDTSDWEVAASIASGTPHMLPEDADGDDNEDDDEVDAESEAAASEA